MVRTGRRLWSKHPAVDKQLTAGERAADWLKHWFGTWLALGLVATVIAFWIGAQRTSIAWDAYPFILLNLCLSCLAAVQGIILQISANRGDKKDAEVALHTSANTDHLIAMEDELLELQNQQIVMLRAQDVHQDLLEAILAKADPAALAAIKAAAASASRASAASTAGGDGPR